MKTLMNRRALSIRGMLVQRRPKRSVDLRHSLFLKDHLCFLFLSSILSSIKSRIRLDINTFLIEYFMHQYGFIRNFIDYSIPFVIMLTIAIHSYLWNKEDYEGVMGALQEHMIQRIQLYSDLQKELEAQKDSDEVGRNAQKIAEAEQEQSQKKRIIEILDETLKEDDEEKNTDTNDGEVAASEPGSEQNDSGIIQFENEEKTVKSQEELLKFRAIDKNKEQLEGMFSQSASESDAVREADRLMDAELIRSYDLLTNNDLTEEDKLKEFNNSWDYMHELHYNKMIDRALSKLDFDTWLISKIEFNSHNNLHEVIKDDNIDNPMGGIDMVRDFLTNANPF